MELVRYRPDQAIRWLRMGAETQKQTAKEKTKKVSDPKQRFADHLKNAASAIMDYGKGTYTEAMHSVAEANEFVIQETQLDIVRNGTIKTVPYDRIKAIQLRTDRATLVLDKGTVVIKPFAYLTAGRAKVPVGWQRNGLDVPFELLFEEISARSGIPLTETE